MNDARRSLRSFEQVRSRVEALLAVTDTSAIQSVAAIDGGLNGSSYLVAVAGKRYVVKINEAPGTGLLDVNVQYSLSRRLAAAQITPNPVAVAPGILITEYYYATPMTAAETRQLANVRDLAALLRQLHAQPGEIACFEPSGYSERYLDALGGIGGLSPAERQLATELRELAAAYSAHFSASTCCHNDLVAANFLKGDKGLKLIDFEFAVLAAPILDLASVTVMNQFGPEAEASLIGAYYREQRQPFSRVEFAKVQRLVHLLAHFWARARAGSAADSGVAQYIDPTVKGHD